MEVDEALTKLGRYSKWQMLKYAMLSTSVSVMGAWHMLVYVFFGASPPHTCHIPQNTSIETFVPIEVKNGKREFSKCFQYANSSWSNDTIGCQHGWDYDPDYGPTIVSEWDLVCGKEALIGTVQTIFSGGVLIGAFIFTWLADRYGRKPVHLITNWGVAVCGIISAFVPNYTAFAALQLIRGALREGSGITGIVMMTELFPSGERTFAGTAFELVWAISWMLLALLGYLIRDWHYLMLTISVIPLFSIAYYWFLPESIVWLMTNNEIDKAEAILRGAAKFNGVEMPEKILKRPHARRASRRFSVMPVEGPYRVTFIDVLKSKMMVMYGSIMCFVWFCSTLVYYALSFSTDLLGGNRFVNFSLSGLVELPAYFVPIYVLKRFGRRKPIFVFQLIAGICLGVCIFIPKETAGGTNLRPLLMTFTMIGKFGITASFASLFLYAPEIYPTNVRNFGVGISSVAGRVGGMFSPFYTLLAEGIDWLPGLVCAVLSIVAGGLLFLLPETVDKPLPNTIKDIERWRVKDSDKKERGNKGDEATLDQML